MFYLFDSSAQQAQNNAAAAAAHASLHFKEIVNEAAPQADFPPNHSFEGIPPPPSPGPHVQTVQSQTADYEFAGYK